MTQMVAHRGPDGEGVFIRGRVAIGHRRLAIIDLARGAQPMSNESGTIWITYNGEIYNFGELRELLSKCGHIFRTNSDTEVVVHAYEEWGAACVERFRGMFAFAVVDYERQQLFLARDHFGIKPLYYRIGSNFLAFASELPALQVIDAPASEGDLFAVELFLRFQYIPAPNTIFRDVRKLLPAHTLVCRFDGAMESPRRFWWPRFDPDPRITEADATERLDQVLSESVRAHLVADVPFGLFLSGGIDSTLIARAMAKHVSPLKAFTIGFEEGEFDEVPYAREAARQLGIDLNVEVVKAESVACLPELVRRYGEPFGDDSAVPTSYLCRFARHEVPMVLSGDGGDELFGGYHSYVGWMERASRDSRYRLHKLLPRDFWKRLRGRPRYQTSDWIEHMLYVRDPERRALWRPEFHDLMSRPCEAFERASKEAQAFHRLAYAQHVDINTYLPYAILTKVDVASMSHGLEVRVPFLDLRVMELAASLPEGLCFGQTPSGARAGKMVPKRLLQREYRHSFVYRSKQGFVPPHKIWFQHGKESRNYVEEALLAPESRLGEWFSLTTIRRFLEQHGKEKDYSKHLWFLWVLAIWKQQNPNVVFRE